ncbi:hypothetical protein [Prescottella subtropica]|uniref:hypothetical protein n=1 Tax=Prescottella subtropica TaxID=2545757 RepID=UPI0010FA55CE|nr:hypothetical protein [Prescottella subtropica]
MKNVVGWIAAFLVLAFVMTYWKWLVAAAIIGGIVWAGCAFGVPLWQRRQQQVQDRRNGETARRSALAARADIQHQQHLAGEDRGIYGNFPPTALD